MTGQELNSAALPKGPHSLTREEVLASQRARLLTATLNAVGQCGYATLKVERITSEAHVSRTAFYEQFTNKEDAFLQAYDSFGEAFLAQLIEVSSLASHPLAAVESSTKLLVGWLTERPLAARAWLLEIYALGDRGLDRRASTMRAVEEAFGLAARWIRRLDPELSAVRPLVARGVVAASFELLSEAVRDPTPQQIAEATTAISDLWIMGMTSMPYEPGSSPS